ncbi:unannotated protein [freshwater metagenome]|uniref:Unannotated protein n=1 Tax=freshwater metagenome TaxID=449393 RepID=A0A6J7CDS1_9ZZZZ
MADDCEAQTGAAALAAASPVDAVEALEDTVEIAGRNAHAVIADFDLHPAG